MKKGAPGTVRDGVRRRGRAAGGAGGPVPARRGRGPGGGGTGDPDRDDQAGRRPAGGPAGPGCRVRRPGGDLRGRAPGQVRVLPGQGHRHGARAGHRAPRLLPLRPVPGWCRAPRRGAGNSARVLVAGAALDGRARRDRGPVRQGRRPAGRAGRDQPDRQAGGTLRRSRRCRRPYRPRGRVGGDPGPPGDPVPALRAAARHALHRG